MSTALNPLTAISTWKPTSRNRKSTVEIDTSSIHTHDERRAPPGAASEAT
jgi:hypothetical protein